MIEEKDTPFVIVSNDAFHEVVEDALQIPLVCNDLL